MKKIIGLSIAALLVIAMVTVGTLAYFSDTELSTGNTITAGTLNLIPAMSGSISGSSGSYAQSPNLSDGVDGHVTFSNVSPGNSGSIEWVLYNDGNLTGTLTLAATTVTFAENGSNEPEAAVPGNNGGTNGDLDEYMGMWVQVGTDSSQAAAESALANVTNGGTTTGYVPISGLQTVLTAITSQAMAASGGNNYVVIKINWSLASNLKAANAGVFDGTGTDVDDNIIQSDTITINVSFVLEQVHP
jgi:predicted ribosomally synthesized peptide with SipW-like signal peptide